MAPPKKTFQLLELNIISAQDLEPVSKKMKTYATAWMNPKRKLSSCVDALGNNNPTWNDKFVFRVEEEVLRRETAAVMIEIYAAQWFRKVLIGTVSVLVGNLIPPPENRVQQNGFIGMRFVALQVRRPSGRPQGILNVGVTLLDPSMRSMPLYTQPAVSAVGFRDLMEDPPALPHAQLLKNANNDEDSQASALKPILRRTRSDRSEFMGLDSFSPSGSMILVKGKGKAKESSILSVTECMVPVDRRVKKAGKASSVISGAELRERPRRQKSKKGKASSLVSDSIMSKESPNRKKEDPTADNKPIVGKSVVPKHNDSDHFAPKPLGKYLIGAPFKKGSSVLSDSEVGPSPSEVAAAIWAERRYPLDDNQSSMLDGWSVDESVEGLKSKLERWRMDLPPLYDRGGFSEGSYKSSSTYRSRRGKKDDEDGTFSCFGNIFGYECQCICGKPPAKKGGGRFRSTSTSPGSSSFI